MRPADLEALGRILILAPTGRDAAELERVLYGVGVPIRVLPSFAALCLSLRSDEGVDVAAFFVTEEALAGGAEVLATYLEQQPPWSDIPIVILTAGSGRRGSWDRWARFRALGNVTLLDRPLHAEVLQSVDFR